MPAAVAFGLRQRPGRIAGRRPAARASEGRAQFQSSASGSVLSSIAQTERRNSASSKRSLTGSRHLALGRGQDWSISLMRASAAANSVRVVLSSKGFRSAAQRAAFSLSVG